MHVYVSCLSFSENQVIFFWFLDNMEMCFYSSYTRDLLYLQEKVATNAKTLIRINIMTIDRVSFLLPGPF